MCANELNSEMLKFPQMKLTEIKTIANSNTMNNGFDGENEDEEDNNGDYVNGGKFFYSWVFLKKGTNLNFLPKLI